MRLARPSRQPPHRDLPTHPDDSEGCHAAELSPPQQRLQVIRGGFLEDFPPINFLQGVFTASCKPPRRATGSVLAPGSSFGRLRGGYERSSKAGNAAITPPSTPGLGEESTGSLHQQKEDGIVGEHPSEPATVKPPGTPEQGVSDDANTPEALAPGGIPPPPAPRVRRTHIRMRRGLDPRTWLGQKGKPLTQRDAQLASLAGQRDNSPPAPSAALEETSPVISAETIAGQSTAGESPIAKERGKSSGEAGPVTPPQQKGAAEQAAHTGGQYGAGERDGSWRVGPWKLPHLPSLPGLDRLSHFPSQLWVMLTPPGHPDKQRLMTVQDFFKYTADEGRRVCPFTEMAEIFAPILFVRIVVHAIVLQDHQTYD
jgi:hypothetical protein